MNARRFKLMKLKLSKEVADRVKSSDKEKTNTTMWRDSVTAADCVYVTWDNAWVAVLSCGLYLVPQRKLCVCVYLLMC